MFIKALLLIAQKEMMNMLLETGESEPLLYLQKALLTCALSYTESITCKQWTLNFAKISKQSIEGAAWFLLATYNKVQDKREKLKEELLCKKEPGLDDLWNSPDYERY